jgi:dienelactone hydrolase
VNPTEPTPDAAAKPKPRRRNFSPWAQWMLDLDAAELVDPCPIESDAPTFAAWAARTRARLDSLLGPWPTRVAPDLEVTDSVACDGYRRDRVVFDTEATMSVPAYLLVPDGAEAGPPRAAVLAIHGHGSGKDMVCDIDNGDEAERAELDSYNGAYAHELARRGYVVLAPDLRCFGERLDWTPPEKYACDANLVHAVMAGRNPLGQNLWDLARSLDVLEALPYVDADRIGAGGLSYGGTCALFLAAIDPRVKAAVVSGYVTEYAAAHRVPFNLCGSQVVPDLLREIDHVGLLALIAPRAVHIESGTEDLIFPPGVCDRGAGARAPRRRRRYQPRRVRRRSSVARRRRLSVL